MSHTKNHLMEVCGDDLRDFAPPTDEEQQEAHEYFEAATAFPTLAAKADLFKKAVKEQILNGYLNPLEFYRQAKVISECIEELKKDADVFECAFTETQKYPKGKAEVNGSIITIQTRNTPDYKSCNDSTYNRLKEELKEREAFLKTIPPQGTVDPLTGELIMPPVTSQSQYITVKI